MDQLFLQSQLPKKQQKLHYKGIYYHYEKRRQCKHEVITFTPKNTSIPRWVPIFETGSILRLQKNLLLTNNLLTIHWR